MSGPAVVKDNGGGGGGERTVVASGLDLTRLVVRIYG